MSVHQQQLDATRQNLAMAVAGFLMAGTIIVAGVGGFVLGHQIAPATVVTSTPATTANTTASQVTTSALAITVKGDAAKPGVYHFSPGAITVHTGQKVTLTISNPSTAMHGIAIPEFGVNTMIQPANGGQASAAQVTFTPTKPGSYTAHCIVYCGPGHAEMILRVTVLA